MPEPMTPITLEGRHVRLEPLAFDHVDGLVTAASIDRATYRHAPVPTDRPAMERYVEHLLADHRRGAGLPFVQRRLDTGAVAGCTRYLEPRWWRGRPEPDEIEIGGTWLAADAQRSGVNTEAKLLLLEYAFETLGVWRVAICTDVDNARSRAAIERLGATFEGVLRNHRLVANTDVPTPRQTATYSVLPDEWPRVRAGLVVRLAGAPAG